MLGACTDPPIAAQPNPLCASIGCSDECETLRVEPCDIADEPCRLSVLTSVQCTRGLELVAPPHVAVVEPHADAGAATQRADSGVAANAPDGGSIDNPLTTPSRADAHYSKAMQLLGLLEPGLQATAATAREFEGSSGSFGPAGVQVVTQSDETQWRNMARLAHEYVHAIQEERLDTKQWRARLADEGVRHQAFRAHIEGEADLYERLSLAFMQRKSLAAADIDEQLRKRRDSSLRAIARSESPGASAWVRVPYRAGAAQHWTMFMQRGRRGTDQLADDPPHDLAAWMRRDPVSTTLRVRCSTDVVPPASGAERTSATEEGASLLLALLFQVFPSQTEDERSELWDRAGAWRGDCFEVFATPNSDGTEATSVRWTFAVEDQSAAVELRDVLLARQWLSRESDVTTKDAAIVVTLGE